MNDIGPGDCTPEEAPACTLTQEEAGVVLGESLVSRKALCGLLNDDTATIGSKCALGSSQLR